MNDLSSLSNFTPYGMQMPGRNTPGGDYRYGYNGMEMDNEVSDNGNSYTTEYRQYDPRLGRWKSLDPLMTEFPHMSPYVVFDNNPVFFVDPLGLAAEGGPGEPDKVITREGSWKDDRKNRVEILQGMEEVADGTIVQFVYPDDERETEATYTYHAGTDGGTGKWEGRYTYNTSLDATASWNIRAAGSDGEPGSDLNLGGDVPLIAKTPPPPPPIEETNSGEAGSNPPSTGNPGGPPGGPPPSTSSGGSPGGGCNPVNVSINFRFNAGTATTVTGGVATGTGRTPTQQWNWVTSPVNRTQAQTELRRIAGLWQPCNTYFSITINTTQNRGMMSTPVPAIGNRTSMQAQIARGLYIRNTLISFGVPASAFSQAGGAWLFVNWSQPIVNASIRMW